MIFIILLLKKIYLKKQCYNIYTGETNMKVSPILIDIDISNKPKMSLLKKITIVFTLLVSTYIILNFI